MSVEDQASWRKRLNKAMRYGFRSIADSAIIIRTACEENSVIGELVDIILTDKESASNVTNTTRAEALAILIWGIAGVDVGILSNPQTLGDLAFFIQEYLTGDRYFGLTVDAWGRTTAIDWGLIEFITDAKDYVRTQDPLALINAVDSNIEAYAKLHELLGFNDSQNIEAEGP